MNRRHLVLSAALASLAGCATEPPKPLFEEAANQTLPPPPADRAQIVFIEPINTIQGGFPVGIFKLDGDRRMLLATTGAHSKAAVLLPPGRHTLMSAQLLASAHLLDVNVEAGKRYHVLVRFIYGRGFQLRPIRTSGPSDYSVANKDYATWWSSTRLVESTPQAAVHFEGASVRLAKLQADALTSWQAKTPEERAELTLNPQDAITR